jgi:hypothetical protein
MNAGVASSHDEGAPRSAPHRTETLSRTTVREVSDSQSRRDALFSAASALAHAAGTAPLTSLITDRDLASLALALATEHDNTTAETHREALPFATALNRYLTALNGAIPAVRTCRQTAHSVNTCWFLTASTDCGDVLKCAHHHAG